jgi:hypothetical protein
MLPRSNVTNLTPGPVPRYSRASIASCRTPTVKIDGPKLPSAAGYCGYRGIVTVPWMVTPGCTTTAGWAGTAIGACS